jgi:hypothetical protein
MFEHLSSAMFELACCSEEVWYGEAAPTFPTCGIQACAAQFYVIYWMHVSCCPTSIGIVVTSGLRIPNSKCVAVEFVYATR